MRFRVLWLLALASLLPCSLQCASLTFGQAVELALRQSDAPAQALQPAEQSAAASIANTAGQTANKPSCPVLLEDYASIAMQLVSANESGFSQPILSFASPFAGRSALSFDLQSRNNVVLCTALLYAKLEGIQAQQRVVHKQQELIARLLDIESRRVSAQVDHPLLLTQAKLLRARNRLESAVLDDSERKTRAALGAAVGLPFDQLDKIEDSVPLLPDEMITGENRVILQRLQAYRDIVQIEYLAEFTRRLKVNHDIPTGHANVGGLVAAHLNEQMKFNTLLHFNNQVLQAKIQFLGRSGGLEAWAFESRRTASQRPESGTASNLAHTEDGASPVSVLIAPVVKELPAGRTQQYSAIATYANGHAKDLTSEVTWSCSSDNKAIVSSTGLLTALSVGQVTIFAEFHGLTYTRELAVSPQPADDDIP